MGKYASALAKKRKVPFVMTMHSQYKYDFMKYTKNESIVNMLLNNIVKVFSKSDEVWTMHEKVADALRSYGYKGKFFFVPNATDYPVPKNPQQYEEFVNNKYNLPKDLPVFLFVGRLVLQKNLLFILDALKILSDNNIDFRMFFIGDGPDKDELKKRITESGITNYSIFFDKETNILFGYQEVEGDSNSQDSNNADEITHQWWDYMSDIMEVNPDNSPVTVPVNEVFHLD